ncbi:phosphate ABC transporter permease PstA [Halopiger aswanensis]|uniref:Phosphate transport system permease protein PstA n=1 Tax=Halopiger aswanensis TaxID=148449 RepID=A0A419WQ54_9EURY|nr:phosphate ABC transporter permease PstA [Halopiger aswanensis]RKD97585.1 phosphate ABC transporter membrane protein 2 (PhoT family) [Halopiger aswanensis]
MAAEQPQPPAEHGAGADHGFGQVSRLKGVVFEALSFGASLTGIAALAVLLIYVAIDAFDLANASPEWLLTYFATLVLPLIGFCLYSANDADLTRRIVLALGGGLVGTAVVFQAFEALVRPIPRLTWQLAYLFVVVTPVTAYVVFAGSREPVGRVGFGLVGRFLIGTALGLALILLFIAVDQRLWFLVYTAGFLPAAVLFAYGQVTETRPLTILAAPVALVGSGAAIVADGTITVYPTTWLIYSWTFVVPVAAGIAGLEYRRTSEANRALLVGALTFALPVGGSFVAGTVGLSQANAVLVLLMIVVPVGAYIRQALESEGQLGLVLPVLLAAGVLLGAFIVETVGIPAPDPWLDVSYVTSPASRDPSRAGLYPAIVGSVFLLALVAVFSFVFGVGTAVFLEEYAPNEGVLGTITRIIQINIANLAAVPSVVYGMLGLGLFAQLLGLGFGTVITGAATLSLLILPVTIISAQEAIRSVPSTVRQGSYAMGATRWQTTKNVVLPESLSGILTGTILSLGRAIGETAPLIMIGAPTITFSPPQGIWGSAAAMPMQIFAWSSFPQEEFRYGVVAAGVVTLLIVLIGMNATAIIMRNRSERA